MTPLASFQVAALLKDMFSSDPETGFALLDIHAPTSMLLPSKVPIETAGLYRGRPIIDLLSVLNGFALRARGDSVAIPRVGENHRPAPTFDFRVQGVGDSCKPIFEPEAMVGYLNEIVRCDFHALYYLFAPTISCNEAMADRGDLPIRSPISPGKMGAHASVSLLDVLNAACGYGADATCLISFSPHEPGFVVVSRDMTDTVM